MTETASHSARTYNDALTRVAATYCATHRAVPGEPCYRFDGQFPRNVVTGYCNARINAATEATRVAAVHAERERARMRNRAA